MDFEGSPVRREAEEEVATKEAHEGIVAEKNEEVKSDELVKYEAEARRFRQLPRDEEEKLVREFQKGSKLAEHKLIRSYLWQVLNIVKGEYKSEQAHWADLIQEGNLGLISALKKFDPNRGVRLGTYAEAKIKSAIQQSIRHRKGIGTTRAERVFLSTPKHWSDREIADHINIRTKAKKKNAISPTDVAEMRLRVNETSQTSFVDEGSIGHPSDAEEKLMHLKSRQIFNTIVSKLRRELSEREKTVLDDHLLKDEPVALTIIAKRWGVTPTVAKNVKKTLLEKLRVVIADSGLSPSDLD